MKYYFLAGENLEKIEKLKKNNLCPCHPQTTVNIVVCILIFHQVHVCIYF